MNEISGAALGAELFKLLEAAEVFIPKMGDVYATSSATISSVEAHENSAFANFDGGGTQEKWATLRERIYKLYSETEENLGDISKALMYCVDAYAAADDEAAEQLSKQVKDNNENPDIPELSEPDLESEYPYGVVESQEAMDEASGTTKEEEAKRDDDDRISDWSEEDLFVSSWPTPTSAKGTTIELSRRRRLQCEATTEDRGQETSRRGDERELDGQQRRRRSQEERGGMEEPILRDVL